MTNTLAYWTPDYQVGFLPAYSHESVFDVGFASDDIVKLLLNVGQLELQVLPELDGGRLGEFGVFQLENRADLGSEALGWG